MSRDNKTAKIAKIVRVHTYSLRDYPIPVYRVVMQRPNGTFLESPKRTLRMFPGDVFRGYKIANRPEDKASDAFEEEYGDSKSA